MYDRTIDGELNSFGVSGKLIRNTLVMYDRNTESLWTQILGEAIEGPLQGTTLTYVPSLHLTWQEWKDLHPDTVALAKGFSGNRDTYANYYRSGQTGIIGRTIQDNRLQAKEFVVGVNLGSEAVAYPFSDLNAQPVVNDTIDGTPILVAFDANSGAASVFGRTVADQTLTFEETNTGMLRDRETGSLWNPLSGQAVEGPLQAESLSPIKSTAAFWFGWVDWFPDSRIFGPA